ncbi:MAG: LPS export ABC transporter permease LptG [Rubellimicrobium sp.]|nr:LPS export ABC transporter permease LptG [Rubellimicrobium sp.]
MRLHLYLARRFLATFAAVAGGFLAVIVLVDLIEGARRGTGGALRAALLHAPGAFQSVLPLVMILASVALFLALARSSELVAVRAAGRSAITALMAPLAAALVLALVAMIALGPMVAATSRAIEQDRGGGNSALAMNEGGLWLRQGDANGQTVIHAARSGAGGTVLEEVSFLGFAADGRPETRIEAARATLHDGAWQIEAARVWPLTAANPEAAVAQHARMTLPATLTAEDIRDSFAGPETIAIWDLPDFIARLRAAGFQARQHEVHLQGELAQPLLLIAMVMIGAAFTMRPQRGGRTGLMVLVAVCLAFGVHFLRNFARILGDAGQIPPALAAWAPPLAAVALALALLLQFEDG